MHIIFLNSVSFYVFISIILYEGSNPIIISYLNRENFYLLDWSKSFFKNYDFIRVYIYFLRCITRFSFYLLKEVLGTCKKKVFCAYKCASFLHFFFSFNHFLKYPILLFSSFQFSLFSRIPCLYICSLLFPPLLIQSRLFIQNG